MIKLKKGKQFCSCSCSGWLNFMILFSYIVNSCLNETLKINFIHICKQYKEREMKFFVIRSSRECHFQSFVFLSCDLFCVVKCSNVCCFVQKKHFILMNFDESKKNSTINSKPDIMGNKNIIV